MKVELEHAYVYGSVTDACMAHGKSWGNWILSVNPVPPDVPISMRVVCLLKRTSKQRQRREWRNGVHEILPARVRFRIGNWNAKLPTAALKLNKGEFVRGCGQAQRQALRSYLDLTPEKFWDAMRNGHKFGPGASRSSTRNSSGNAAAMNLTRRTPYPDPRSSTRC